MQNWSSFGVCAVHDLEVKVMLFVQRLMKLGCFLPELPKILTQKQTLFTIQMNEITFYEAEMLFKYGGSFISLFSST